MAVIRRNFLRGVLAAVAGGEALVRLAEPNEVHALAVGQPALVTQPAGEDASLSLGGMAFVQTSRGDYVPIGYITSVRVDSYSIDATMMTSGEIALVPGLPRGVAHFEAPYEQRAAHHAIDAVMGRRR